MAVESGPSGFLSRGDGGRALNRSLSDKRDLKLTRQGFVRPYLATNVRSVIGGRRGGGPALGPPSFVLRVSNRVRFGRM